MKCLFIKRLSEIFEINFRNKHNQVKMFFFNFSIKIEIFKSAPIVEMKLEILGDISSKFVTKGFFRNGYLKTKSRLNILS